eukprot:3152224-Alexandrium_andersonii.AAC.1
MNLGLCLGCASAATLPRARDRGPNCSPTLRHRRRRRAKGAHACPERELLGWGFGRLEARRVAG